MICEQLKQIEIIHVYGSVGNLPNLSLEYTVAYGDHKIQNYPTRVKNLKLIPELRDKSDPKIELAKDKLQNAKNIFSLGFGYDPANIKLLGFPFKSKQANVRLAGTFYGLEEGQRHLARVRTILDDSSDTKQQLNELPNTVDVAQFFNHTVIKAFA